MSTPAERRHYIDWIRVLAFFLLIFFHCAMPFVSFGWEIKNKETSAGLSRLIWWLHQWRLPLLFFISGAGIHYSLQKRPVWKFAGERIIRLLIPLLFAMFFTIPLQVYFERLQTGKFSGSYASFYPSVWDAIPYPEGTLTWSHMWFVVYLFVFCILLLPVFALFKIRALQQLKASAANLISHPLALLLPVLPFLFYYPKLYLQYPEQQSLLDDWFLFVSSLTFLCYGYWLGGSHLFWERCERYRFHFMGVALITGIFLMSRYWWNMQLPRKADGSLYRFGAANSLMIWCMILSLCGWAKKHLNFSNRFLQYCNQAVYPFYILHQTVIVGMGYYVVQTSAGIPLKLTVLIVLCFASVGLLYHWLIRPFMLTRILFGLKPRRRLLQFPNQASATGR